MSQLKIVRLSGILLIVLGVIVATISVVAYPIGNSTIDTMQTMSFGYLGQAESMLSNSQNMVSSAQVTLQDAISAIEAASPALSDGVELTNNAVNTLNSLESTTRDVGTELSSISILGWRPLESVGSRIATFVNPIQEMEHSLQNISSSLNNVKTQTASITSDIASVNNQLSQFKDSISQIKNALDQTVSSLPNYFAQAKLALTLVIMSFVAIGVILIIAGISTLSLRRELIETRKRVERS